MPTVTSSAAQGLVVRSVLYPTRAMILFLLCCAWVSWCPFSLAQTGSATLSGTVLDASGRAVPGTEVAITNVDTNAISSTRTNGAGIYVLEGLKPGRYRINVSKQGFKQITVTDVTLNTQDSVSRNFNLVVGAVSESVIVNASDEHMATDDPAVGILITREFVANMPLNGRSFQDLIQLSPGTVSDGNGFYSINGQRTDGNNFTVDGVSANLGGILNSTLQYAGSSGSGLSGSTPLQTASGTTQSLASVDSLQEFKIQTSGYSAEFGRSPGGQLEFTTRSGTNDIHGTLFEYFRNEALDAKSYADNFFGTPKQPERQNDFGGTVGGPLKVPKLYNGTGKTFYFFSYEGLRLKLPEFEEENVPTQAFRDWASPDVRPFLNQSPLPNPSSPGNQDGCTIPDPATGLPAACDALFAHGYANVNSVDNISVRVDQVFGQRFAVFLRYADTPSSSSTGAEQAATAAINTHTWTAALTANLTNRLLNDLRFNFTHDGEEIIYSLNSFGGSVPWSRNLLIPPGYDSPTAYAQAGFFLPGTSLNTIGLTGGAGTAQHQYQIVDGLTMTRSRHTLKFGVDWRRLTPFYSAYPYQAYLNFTSLSDIQNGYASSISTSQVAPGQPVFQNLSLYSQDHWRFSSRLSFDYGLRWEFNPPPEPSNGHYPATLTSSDLATAQLAPLGTAPYKTTYDHFAPRVGFAWNAIPSLRHAVTVRGAFGIFFDTGQQAIGNAYARAYPFSAPLLTQTELSLPLSAASLQPPPLNMSLTPPYPNLQGISSPNLTLPYTEQWNLSVDQALGQKNTLTVSYVGNVGRKLLYTQYFGSSPEGNPFSPRYISRVMQPNRAITHCRSRILVA
jgi:hypothetical protein